MSKYYILDDDPLLQTIHMDWGLSNEEIKKEHEEALSNKLKELESYLRTGEPEYDKEFLMSLEGSIKRIKEILGG